MKPVLLVVLAGALLTGGCGDGTAPPHPTTITVSGASQATAQVAAAITGLSVVVADQHGAAMAGQPLQVTVTGGGRVSGAPTATIAGGATSLGTWTLGTAPGPNVLTVTSGGLTAASVSIQVTAGPPAQITSPGAQPAISTVGAPYAMTVRVSDAYGNAVAGVNVTFSVAGGGSLAAAAGVSDATGNVAVPGWTLGTVRGANTLTAAIGALSQQFTVVAQAGPASALSASVGASSAPAGTSLPGLPVATVRDRFGNGVPRQAVTFAATTGGGTLVGTPTVLSDTNGVAPGPAWVLGKRNIPQQLLVSTGALSASLNATVQTAFVIDLRFFGTGMTDTQKAAFLGAAQRVSAMIMAGVGPVNANGFDVAVSCGVPGVAPLSESIPGIIIYASIGAIDEPGKVLAQAGPCGFRGGAAHYQPGVAMMEFDAADLVALAAGGSLEDVATHEMMHSIGLGTVWDANGLSTGAVAVDPRYTGPNGIQGCVAIGGVSTCAQSVPEENTGGAGTAGGHWRETVFTNELMTGYLNPGPNPLSVMSIRAMADLGYSVDLAAADAYTPLAAVRTPFTVSPPATPWERLIGMPPVGTALHLVSAGGGLLRVTRDQ